ncbi:MAG: DUF4426 domain-containing protein [Gammaproteobacteria bacterium]|nr:DUF4426 domain-containing protein [Gammaproteobacteria bacterium]
MNASPVRLYLSLLAILLSVMFSVAGRAEQSETFGEYTVHYNAITTNFLEPTVARTYNIVRSPSRAMVNITVMRNTDGPVGEAAQAAVEITAINLARQVRTVNVRELNDGGGIYYIGDFPFTNEETLEFVVKVKPEGQEKTHTLSFRQQFFVD